VGLLYLGTHHPDAVVFADLEMPVVAGHGTEERNLALLRPRHQAVARSLQQRVHDGVVHQRQAGVVAHHNLLRRCAQYSGEQPAHFRNSLEPLVVAAIGPVFGNIVGRAGKRQQLRAQIQLRRRRLAARQVQSQALGLEGVVAFLDLPGRGENVWRGELCGVGHWRRSVSFVRCARALSVSRLPGISLVDVEHLNGDEPRLGISIQRGWSTPSGVHSKPGEIRTGFSRCGNSFRDYLSG
jgi:hypothetical protein